MNAQIRNLLVELEAARLSEIQRLTIDTVTSSKSIADVRNLADLQTALIAVREVLEAHEPRLGRGSETPVLGPTQ